MLLFACIMFAYSIMQLIIPVATVILRIERKKTKSIPETAKRKSRAKEAFEHFWHLELPSMRL